MSDVARTLKIVKPGTPGYRPVFPNHARKRGPVFVERIPLCEVCEAAPQGKGGTTCDQTCQDLYVEATALLGFSPPIPDHGIRAGFRLARELYKDRVAR